MSKFSVKKPMTIFVAVVLVCILGFISFTSMTTDLLPQDGPALCDDCATPYPGAGPEDESSGTFTKPLEQAPSTTSGVKASPVRPTKTQAWCCVEFAQGTNLDSAMIEMSGNIDIVKANLDDAAGTPTLIKINPDVMPIMVPAWTLTARPSRKRRRSSPIRCLPEFERIDGVALPSRRDRTCRGFGRSHPKPAKNRRTEPPRACIGRRKSLRRRREKIDNAKSQIESGKQQLKSMSQTQAQQLVRYGPAAFRRQGTDRGGPRQSLPQAQQEP